MIKYRLVCSEGHEFEGWFRSSAAYDDQEARGQIGCAQCGTSSVTRAVMAPNVATRSSAGESREAAGADARFCDPKQRDAMMRELRASVEAHSEYVGPRFAEEARRIHYEETQARGVHGEASGEEVRALWEEGIPVFPLPRLREDLN